MTTIKSYTDIEQSRKLAEILPLESADMYYDRYKTPSFIDNFVTHKSIKTDKYQHLIPCWSLAALLGVLPNEIGIYYKTIGWFDGAWHCDYMDEDSECKYFSAPCDNPIDACVAMIIKLNELNLL